MSPRLARPADARHIAALEESFETGRWSEAAWAEEIASQRAHVVVEGDADAIPLGVSYWLSLVRQELGSVGG